VPDGSFGAELPHVREWAKDRFTFTGAIADGGIDVVAARLAELL
jgi:hypothetical protein